MVEQNDPGGQQPPHEAREENSNTELAGTTLPDGVDRWTLLRDVTVFQGKLILDGLRDLILSPVSIAAALIGIIAGGDRPGRQFYDLLYLGKRSEKWINLFGAAAHVQPSSFHKEDSESVDALVDRLETVARRQYEKGGMTQNAKDAVDRALDAVNKGLSPKK